MNFKDYCYLAHEISMFGETPEGDFVLDVTRDKRVQGFYGL